MEDNLPIERSAQEALAGAAHPAVRGDRMSSTGGFKIYRQELGQLMAEGFTRQEIEQTVRDQGYTSLEIQPGKPKNSQANWLRRTEGHTIGVTKPTLGDRKAKRRARRKQAKRGR